MKEVLQVAAPTPIDLAELPAAEPASKERNSVEVVEKKPTEETTKETEETEETEKPTEEPTEEPKGKTEDRPAAPMRPGPRAAAVKSLLEAFPQLDPKHIEAIVIAAHGSTDHAFNACLFLADPDYAPEAPAAPTEDEVLARRLQKQFEHEDRRRRRARPQPREESPDDFEQLKETFAQGYEEAKTTINGWVAGLSRRMAPDPKQQQKNPRLFGALGGSLFNLNDRKKFDEDPEILSLDFRRDVTLKESAPPLPKRKDDAKWEPLNLDVPVKKDAFLVDDSEDEVK